MAITVHHLANSRSQRVLWLLEELALEYTITRYERDPQSMMAPADLKRVHPLGKSPLIVDQDAGVTVAETGAIVEYLVGRAGGAFGGPDDPEGARNYRFWLHYAEGSMMPPLLLKLAMSRVPVLGKFAMRKVQPMIDVHLDYVEAQLSQREWFAGAEISAADVMMSFPLEAARHRAGLDEDRPSTMRWLARIHARPAYRTALARGGPYDYA